jgi:hypothetical protein
MIGAVVASLLLQAAASPPVEETSHPQGVPLVLERARPRVGERVVLTATLPAATGERLRFERPPEVDAAFARVEPILSEATGRGEAALRIEMVAAAAGTFRVGPFFLHADRGGAGGTGSGRVIETSALDVEVGPSWSSGKPPGFDEWRGPAAPPVVRSTRLWPWFAAAGALLALALGWIALRRRGHPESSAHAAPPPPRNGRAELDRLAAHIPEGVAARRLWWSEIARVLRDELARRWRDDTPDRTTEELAATQSLAAAASDAIRRDLVDLLRRADEGKFARASAGIAAASAAVTSALRLLERAAQVEAGPP